MILVSQSNYGTSSDRTYALFLYEDIPFEPETILVGFSAGNIVCVCVYVCTSYMT